MAVEKLCKVLIVDNDLAYAAKIASELAKVSPSVLENNALQIELSNTAYFVAAQLAQCSAHTRPWDIIIADVYMPQPSPRPNSPSAETALRVDHKAADGKTPFTSWRYDYTWNSEDTGAIEHGALHIAETIQALEKEGMDLGNLKLVAISAVVSALDNERMWRYERAHPSWFQYYDKTRLGSETSSRELTMFKGVLINAIRERESALWGTMAVQDLLDDARIIEEFVAVSSRMTDVVTQVKRCAADATVRYVLIQGLTGTGKTAVARLLHKARMVRLGTPADRGPFCAASLAGGRDEFLESQLFGYAPGAYTGGLQGGAPGLLELAREGTLFLDEIGDCSPSLQEKLLEPLGERKFRRMGEAQVRERTLSTSLVVSATNKDLDTLVQNNEMFREDLYARIAAETIRIPPLSERKGDIIPIAQLAAGTVRAGLEISAEGKQWLLEQSWPRNVRHLVFVVQKAARDCDESLLTTRFLQQAYDESRGQKRPGQGTPTAPSLMAGAGLPDVTGSTIAAGTVSYEDVQRRFSGPGNYARRAVLMLAAQFLREREHSAIKWQHSVNQFFSEIRHRVKDGRLERDELKNSLLSSLPGEKMGDVEEFFERFLNKTSPRDE